MGLFVGAIIECDHGLCQNRLYTEKPSTAENAARNNGWKSEKITAEDVRWYCPTHKKKAPEM